jgi:serine/threonine-protein kinase RIM15
VISDIDEEMEDNQISSRLDERSDPQQDLLQASGKNPSILLELDMDGHVKHLSKAWESVVGTRIAKIVNHPISRIIMGTENDKNVFVDAIRIMMTDDESYRIRFVVATNYALPDDEENLDLDTSDDSGEVDSPNDSIDIVDQESLSSLSTNGQVIELEGQGILIHDKMGIPTHSMWILKPFYPNTLNIELPPKLAESLGFGADIFASYLASLSDLGIIYEGDVPPPPQVLCRICEQQVPSWWLERHSQLCYNEHKCQSEVEMIHDMVIEQKKIIVSITESLNAQSKGIDEGVKDYKGESLPKVSPPEASKSSTPLTRRPRSGSIMNTLRFPFKTLALLTELCETAIAINPSEFNEEINAYEFSPNTKEAFELVSAFAIPDSSDLAISLLINDTEKLVKEKADAVDRLKSSLMYSQKIKDEVDELILLTITEAVKNIRNQTFDIRPPIARPMSPNQSQASDSAQSGPLSEKNMSGIVYPKPKPMTVHSNIFTEAYLDTDSLPSPTPGPHYRDGLSENRGRFSPARSITPGTESTSKDVSFDNDATYPGLSDLQIRSPLLTPQRKMSPGVPPGSQNSPMSSIQRNSRSHGFDSGSGTPAASPMIMAHEGPAMEKKGSQSEQFLSVGAMMKPPLSPLLVAMPAPKSIAPSIKEYEIVKPISKGAFGSVYLARRKVTGEYFAIKVLKKSDMIAKNQVTNVKAERAIMMAQSDSPYVAKLYSSFQSKDYLFLVMEYLPGGDCATLVKMLGGLPDEWARQYIAEVIAGVDDLHQKGIVHHDLKPDNLLIDFAGHLKLTDFGLSRMGLVRRQERLNKGSVSEEAFGQSTANLTSHNGRQRQDSISALALSSAGDSTASSPTQSFFESIVKGEGRKTSGSSLLGSAPGSAHSSNHGSVSTPALDTSLVKPMHRSSSHTSFVLPDYETSTPATPGSKNMALFDPENASKYKKFVGTPDYLAPETIRGTGECEASDWWSVGCILFEFLFGYPPFHASTPDKVFENILEGEIDWPKLSPEDEVAVCTPEAKDLITKLLIMDPNERLGATGADEIKDHPYFKNLNWENLWQAEGGFIPNLDDPENTDYFESRGADMIEFPMDDASDTEDTQQKPSKDVVKKEKASSATTSLGSPSSANSPTMGKHHLSLAIPIHLRERRPSKLSDGSSEFGSFQFRNLPALDKANKDVINRIKAEHMEHRSSISSSSSESSHMKPRNYLVSSPSALKRASSPSLVRSLSPSRVGSIPQHIVQTPPAVLSSGDDYLYYEHSGRSTPSTDSGSPSAKLFAKPQTPTSGYGYPYPTGRSSRSNLFHKATSDFSPSSSDTEDSRTSALERVRKRRQSSKMSDSSSTRFQMLDILLCEPIPIMRYSIKKDLESLGCVVVSVTAGDELIRRATGEVKFDLIITGLRMAKLDVIDIVKLLKHTSSVNSDTPIIAITAYYKEAVLSGYFNDVLEKPVDKRQLKMVLEKHCRWRVSQTEEAVSDSESEAGSGNTSGVDTIRKK